MIVGNLEEFSAGLVRGWLLDTSDPSRSFSLRVLVDGVLKATIPTQRVRDDVERIFQNTGHGFRFPLSTVINSGKEIVLIQVADCDFQFPNNDRIFLNGASSVDIVADIVSNEELYCFQSDLMVRVESQVKLSSPESRRALKEIAQSTKFVFILFTNRSGSNLVTDMLESMEFGAGTTNEPFLADTIISVTNEHSMHTFEEYFANTIDGWKKNGVFFAKISWDALFWLSSRGILNDIFSRATYVFVRRKDKILQAISYVKALNSGQFFAWDTNRDGNAGEKRETSARADEEKYWSHEDAFISTSKSIHDFYVAECRIAYFLTMQGLEAHDIWYEDMIADLDGAYNRLADYLSGRLGLPPAAKIYRPRLVKQATGAEYAIKETFLHTIRSGLGAIP